MDWLDSISGQPEFQNNKSNLYLPVSKKNIITFKWTIHVILHCNSFFSCGGFVFVFFFYHLQLKFSLIIKMKVYRPFRKLGTFFPDKGDTAEVCNNLNKHLWIHKTYLAFYFSLK